MTIHKPMLLMGMGLFVIAALAAAQEEEAEAPPVPPIAYGQDFKVDGIWVDEGHFEDVTLVVSANAPESDKEAARLFKSEWQRMTGKELNEVSARPSDATGWWIWIGEIGAPMPMLSTMGLVSGTLTPDEKLYNDRELALSGFGDYGYAMQTIGQSLLIIGGGKYGARKGVEAFFAEYDENLQGLGTSSMKFVPEIENVRVVPNIVWIWMLAELCVGLAVLFGVYWLANFYFADEVPILIGLVLSIGAIVSCVWFFSVFMEMLTALVGPEARPMAPILTFGVCFWPIRGYLGMLSASLARRGAYFTYGDPNIGRIDDEDYVPPQVFSMRDDVNDQVKEFRSIFADNPSSPRALFEAAQLLENNDYFDESAEMYREVIQIFHRDSEVWAEANFRLASLHENVLVNKKGAEEILKRVVERAPDTEYGKLASARLDTGEQSA